MSDGREDGVTLVTFGDEADWSRLREWLGLRHVARWWGDPEAQLAACRDRRTGDGHATIALDGNPVGYLRWQRVRPEELAAAGLEGAVPEGSVDVDILLGEKEASGSGVGARALESLVERLREEGEAPLVGMSVQTLDTRAIRAYEKAGFRALVEYHDPEYGSSVVMARPLTAMAEALFEVGREALGARRFLRHALAAAAYRAGKALRDAPDSFGDFRVGPESRTPAEILAHMGDLAEWGASIARGRQRWSDSDPLPWSEELERYFAALADFDRALGETDPVPGRDERIFSGPVADTLNHVGQIAMLRRLAGTPIRGENYSVAAIEVGRVGPEQAKPGREFD